MSITSEIKKLVRENGGTPSGNTAAALLDDFLGASGGGGAGLFMVTFSRQDEDWVCDKTFAEIKAAYEAGMFIYGFSDSNSEYETPLQLSFQYLYESQNWGGACFHSGIMISSLSNKTSLYFMEYIIDYEENINYQTIVIAET